MKFLFPRIQQESDGLMFVVFVLYALTFTSSLSFCCIEFELQYYCSSTDYTFCSLWCSLQFLICQCAMTVKKRKIVSLFLVFNGYIKMKLRRSRIRQSSKLCSLVCHSILTLTKAMGWNLLVHLHFTCNVLTVTKTKAHLCKCIFLFLSQSKYFL